MGRHSIETYILIHRQVERNISLHTGLLKLPISPTVTDKDTPAPKSAYLPMLHQAFKYERLRVLSTIETMKRT